MCEKVFTRLLIAATVLSATMASTPVRKCSTDIFLPLSVQVNNCNEMPCDLWKGFDSHLYIHFVANRNSMTHVQATVHLTTLGIEIPMELEEEHSNVCTNLLYGAYCPLDREEDVIYHLVLPIGEHQPEVPTKVSVSLVDREDNTVISCFVVDARIRK